MKGTRKIFFIRITMIKDSEHNQCSLLFWIANHENCGNHKNHYNNPMNITGILISFVVGYVLAWCARSIIGHFSPVKESCNLHHTGIRWRFILASIFIIIGWYTQTEFWFLASGFTFYESRARWCISRAFLRRR